MSKCIVAATWYFLCCVSDFIVLFAFLKLRLLAGTQHYCAFITCSKSLFGTSVSTKNVLKLKCWNFLRKMKEDLHFVDYHIVNLHFFYTGFWPGKNSFPTSTVDIILIASEYFLKVAQVRHAARCGWRRKFLGQVQSLCP